MAERRQRYEDNSPKKTIEVPVGLAAPGVQVQTQPREVSVEEPPALPVSPDLKSIGKPTPRLDGKLKVSGAAKYTADVRLPGMLFAALITASEPHATIVSIDTSAAEQYPGVKAVHIMEKGERGSGPEDGADAKEATKYPIVRFVGQPLGALCATSQAAADEAARLVKVEYEKIPWVIDPTKAQDEDSPVIFQKAVASGGTAGGGGGPRNATQKGNLRAGPPMGNKEEAEQALKDSDVVVEVAYRTQVQTHSALETHGVVADWKPEGLTCYASTQGTNTVRDELSAVFDLPKAQVRVITEYMGGGFGAKFGAGTHGVLATHLSKQTGKPVRLMLNRREEHLCVGNRPSSIQTLKIGAKKDGTLTAISLEGYGTAGVGTVAGFGGPVRSRAMYPAPVMYVQEADVFTNAGPASAMRAPGYPQGIFALEQAIDELAHKLDMDPLDLRDKIETGHLGPVHKVERRVGAEKIGWANRNKKPGSDPGPIKRGIGMAQSAWHRNGGPGPSCQVRVSKDGSVEFMSSVQDIGSGIRTVLAQVVAEELGLKPTDVRVKIGDTNFPAGPASGGSVTTHVITPPAREAAYHVKLQLLEAAAPAMNAKAEDLELADGKVVLKSDPSKSMSFRAACGKMPSEDISHIARRRPDWQTPTPENHNDQAGVQFVQVAVDTDTGVVRVEKVVAVHDCGRVMNPLTARSQVNGGIIQGISYALYENRLLDRTTAHMVNANLEEYKITGALDCPEIDVTFLDNYIGRTNTDAVGIGEPANIATAAAVANAVYNAIGIRLREIPITPAKVLTALAAEAKKLAEAS